MIFDFIDQKASEVRDISYKNYILENYSSEYTPIMFIREM